MGRGPCSGPRALEGAGGRMRGVGEHVGRAELGCRGRISGVTFRIRRAARGSEGVEEAFYAARRMRSTGTSGSLSSCLTAGTARGGTEAGAFMRSRGAP